VNVDFRNMQLRREGSVVVPLTPQAFKILKFMVQNAERVISRDELLNEVTSVSGSHRSADAILTARLAELRKYVMFVLDQMVRKGDPQPGDMGIMVGLGPGMAAELALLRW
jgi:DNA-binding response OmpR family regulator